ncbi:MAG: type VI secretion system ATPase TssH [Alphaproteobacteria bacterium]|nr:type VI secretion system ATPase TssH [Alphaproteobacteria bacterium]
MSKVNLKALIGVLNEPCRSTLEGAAGLTLSRTQYNVEVEHWLRKLCDLGGTDVELIGRHFGLDMGRLVKDIDRSLDRLQTGNARPPALSPSLISLIREAWLIGSVDLGSSRVRSGLLVLALLSDEALARQAREISSQFALVKPDDLLAGFGSILAGSGESEGEPEKAADGEAAAAPRAPSGASDALSQYTIDLTAQAKSGKIDPVIGRNAEIRQVIDILTRRRQNNPILTGEAGVGKTAVAEGFALAVSQGDVPSALRDVSVRVLDLGLLQAGAGIKGEFENRLKGVIEGVKASEKPVILFIDEAHTLIGAGGQAGQGDAANLLKPALARGELRTIAATTWAEYKKYFEKDPALTRRFQVVKVDEPDEGVGIEIMRRVAGVLAKHHGVRVLDEAVIASVKLSQRYIQGRQLPDKAVSLLDTACARVALSQTSTPSQISDVKRRRQSLDASLQSLQRENLDGRFDAEIAQLTDEQAKNDAEASALDDRWKREQELVGKILDLKKRLDAGADGKPEDLPAAIAEHDQLAAELREIQDEDPLVFAVVDAQAVAAVVENWTGIPVGRMVADEISSVLSLREQMEQRVIGQSHALQAIAESIVTSRARLTDPNKPVGVFLMVGTSGVGKTETALCLADMLYGGKDALTVINMSEFKEEHKVSTLMGAPPGYVGYGEGGILTEAVRRRPYGVVLFDEMEKAHPGVQDVFYQLFDKGVLRDSEGRDVDFRNTVIIMTSNAGTDLISRLYASSDEITVADLEEALRPELTKYFKPAFLGRVKVTPYVPLDDEMIRKIAGLKLRSIGKRLGENYGATFECADEVPAAIAARCTEVESGARNIDHIINANLLPELSRRILALMAEGSVVSGVKLGVDEVSNFSIELT